MEYNINMDNKLSVGDTMSDKAGNKFIVIVRPSTPSRLLKPTSINLSFKGED